MKQTTFFMLTGISGAGKSTWAENYVKEHDDTLYVGSDKMRLRLFGSEEVQDHNQEVFLEMQRITVNALAAGMSVVYDSCALSAKRRASLVRSLKTKYPHVSFVSIVLNTSIQKCYERNSARARVVPLHVIARQLKQFTMPSPWEGWDDIRIIKDSELDYETEYDRIMDRVEAFGDQHNPNHTLSLYDHCEKCRRNALTMYPNRNLNFYLAARLHDCGKTYTQTFDEDGIAHYYGHANVSAYIVMNCGLDPYWVTVVNYHMTCFNKQEGRVWKERLGKKMWNDIKRLHECDINAK